MKIIITSSRRIIRSGLWLPRKASGCQILHNFTIDQLLIIFMCHSHSTEKRWEEKNYKIEWE